VIPTGILAYVKLGFAALAGIAVFVCLWQVNSWRKDAAEKAQVEQLLKEEREHSALHAQADAHEERVTTSAEKKAEDNAAGAEKVRIVYREAIRENPDCAAWAALPIACPLGDWLPAPAYRPSGGMSADTGEPDEGLRDVRRRGCEAENERRTGRGVDGLPRVREGVPHPHGSDQRTCAVSG
jgi:hypothetical protein